MRVMVSRWLLRKRRFCLPLLALPFLFTLQLNLFWFTEPRCSAQRDNFVYIKMIKCASSTLASVFRRYAYLNKLSVVLPYPKRIYLGWPYTIDKHSHRPAKTKHGFNVLIEHSVYNEAAMDALMQPDNVYITSIREPYKQFKSMFHYYRVRKVSLMPNNTADPVTEYLHNLEKYEAVYKSAKVRRLRRCIPSGYSMSRNLMAFNLGFPTGAPDSSLDASTDEDYINRFLSQIETKFKLILIVDYFDESIVLLKRLMCWSMKDILFYAQNVGRYKKAPPSSERDRITEFENIKIYKNWSRVDYRLYDHFLKVFWEKVKLEGNGFYREVNFFRKTNTMVNRFCDASVRGAVERGQKIHVENPGYGEQFTIDHDFCLMMRKKLRDELATYYDQLPIPYDLSNYTETKPKKKFC